MRPFVPPRRVDGVSAVLLPFADGRPDRDAFAGLLARTADAGLTPAVNMDTGYANLLTAAERAELLTFAAGVLGGRRFVAGAFAEGEPDAEAAYAAAIDGIRAAGGTPILFPSTWLKSLGREAKLGALRRFARQAGELLVFELGEMFVPFGEIWDEDFFAAVLEIPEVVGGKHSSLRRDLEWRRLDARDRLRPGFRVYTGNDLAIDLVLWGSDYLLGLSAFHPEAFARRDAWLAAGDDRFFELNDALQYLGAFAFRPPVPAYKHTCAQFLRLRGAIPSDEPHPRGARRPDSDLEVLSGILDRIQEAMDR